MNVQDLYYNTPQLPEPNNTNGLHDQALLCVTDLVDCCEFPRTVCGEWYYPDGNVVPFDIIGERGVTIYRGTTFLKNRGPNQAINGSMVYGSVRLFRRWSAPPGRGHFRYEIPSQCCMLIPVLTRPSMQIYILVRNIIFDSILPTLLFAFCSEV